MNVFVAIVLAINILYITLLAYCTIDDWKKIGFRKGDISVLIILGIPYLINSAVCVAVLVR